MVPPPLVTHHKCAEQQRNPRGSCPSAQRSVHVPTPRPWPQPARRCPTCPRTPSDLDAQGVSRPHPRTNQHEATTHRGGLTSPPPERSTSSGVTRRISPRRGGLTSPPPERSGQQCEAPYGAGGVSRPHPPNGTAHPTSERGTFRRRGGFTSPPPERHSPHPPNVSQAPREGHLSGAGGVSRPHPPNGTSSHHRPRSRPPRRRSPTKHMPAPAPVTRARTGAQGGKRRRRPSRCGRTQHHVATSADPKVMGATAPGAA